MLYEIDDLFMMKINNEVTIISKSEALDLLNERYLDAEDEIEDVIRLSKFIYDPELSLSAIKFLSPYLKRMYFNHFTIRPNKKMPIKQ